MKALKPPLSKLRFDKIAIAAYLDDCLVMDQMKGKCSENTKTIINTFQNSRFTVNPEPKSSFYPTQQIEFLGFEINSVFMTITLTNAKTENLKLFCTNILNSRTPKIRTVASFRENYKHFLSGKIWRIALQRLRKMQTMALCKSNSNFNARTHLTKAVKSDFRLWKEKVNHIYNGIIVPNPEKCIATDASSYGWGALMESQSTGSLFSTS